jgi:hypothetical protein
VGQAGLLALAVAVAVQVVLLVQRVMIHITVALSDLVQVAASVVVAVVWVLVERVLNPVALGPVVQYVSSGVQVVRSHQQIQPTCDNVLNTLP